MTEQTLKTDAQQPRAKLTDHEIAVLAAMLAEKRSAEAVAKRIEAQ